MKKTGKYIAFCVVIALFVAVFALRMNRVETDAAVVPHIDSARNAAGLVDIKKLRGDYVLVNFWDSHNAVSRIAASEYDKFLRRHGTKDFRLLSVNTDTNRQLYQEIVKQDDLVRSSQFHISDTRKGKSAPSYHPEEGYASYLLDPEGKVVAVNPSVEQVEDIVEGD